MENKAVGYVAQFAASLSNDGLALTVNFNMPEDATAQDFGEKLDLLRRVADRQRAKGEVKLLEAALTEKESVLRNFKLDLKQYLKNHAMDDHAERTEARIEELKLDLESGRKILEETRQKAK